MNGELRFVICDNCREHGRIVFLDGTQTREFWTRHMGFDLLIEHQKAGHLTEQQASELGRQVSASGLPMDKSEITHSDKVCPEFQKLVDELKRNQGSSKATH